MRDARLATRAAFHHARRVLGAFVRLLVAIALATGLGPICFDVLHWAARPLHRAPPDAIATSAGVIVGLLFILWRKPNWFIHTAVHELCHLVVCLLVFVRPAGITVTDGRGGAVEHIETDAVRATLIQIAPYTLPLLLIPILVTRQFIIVDPEPWRQVLSAATAFFYITHVQALYHNIRLNLTGDQADLVKVGRPLSFVIIALAMMLVSAWTIRVLWGGVVAGP